MEKSFLEQVQERDLVEILDAARRPFGVAAEEVGGPRRTKHICAARAFFVVALRAKGWSLQAIGDLLGGRHHATIMHAERMAKAMDAAYRARDAQ